MKTTLLNRFGIALVALFFAAAPLYAQDTTDTMTEPPPADPGMETQSEEDIVAIASSRDDLSTLVSAIEAAGLAESLQGEGPYTVFAPTNEAFEKLPEGTLDELLKPENANQLSAILTYHVVPQEAMAADVASMTEASTLLGAPLSISASGDQVMVNDATVTETDIPASNGVIHVVDTVLLPPSPDQQGTGTMEEDSDMMEEDSDMEEMEDTTGQNQ